MTQMTQTPGPSPIDNNITGRSLTARSRPRKQVIHHRGLWEPRKTILKSKSNQKRQLGQCQRPGSRPEEFVCRCRCVCQPDYEKVEKQYLQILESQEEKRVVSPELQKIYDDAEKEFQELLLTGFNKLFEPASEENSSCASNLKNDDENENILPEIRISTNIFEEPDKSPHESVVEQDAEDDGGGGALMIYEDDDHISTDSGDLIIDESGYQNQDDEEETNLSSSSTEENGKTIADNIHGVKIASENQLSVAKNDDTAQGQSSCETTPNSPNELETPVTQPGRLSTNSNVDRRDHSSVQLHVDAAASNGTTIPPLFSIGVEPPKPINSSSGIMPLAFQVPNPFNRGINSNREIQKMTSNSVAQHQVPPATPPQLQQIISTVPTLGVFGMNTRH